ncbi:olfactory receptor 51E1-like, partial [Scleropages formosus]
SSLCIQRTMENTSAVTSFMLTVYKEMEDLKYFYFTVFFLLYLLTLCLNILIIGVIYSEKSLHEPMYIFVCNLAIYCLHTYGFVEFSVLAIMSYDRYIAICHPLRYHIIMSSQKVNFLIALSWIYPLSAFGMYFILTTKLTFCSRFIPKVYCNNFALVKLSCFDTSVHSVIGLIATVLFVLPALLMILFSYAQILRICLLVSKESRIKAVQTCTPHLLAVLNYSIGGLFEIIQSRFNMSYLPSTSRMFMSVYFLVFPPLLNPAIYGLSVQNIRVRVLKLLPVWK